MQCQYQQDMELAGMNTYGSTRGCFLRFFVLFLVLFLFVTAERYKTRFRRFSIRLNTEYQNSEYDPSEQSPVVSALSLTRPQLSGTNSLFLFVILPLSVLLNLP